MIRLLRLIGLVVIFFILTAIEDDDIPLWGWWRR
jgi:hypothetical protein